MNRYKKLTIFIFIIVTIFITGCQKENSNNYIDLDSVPQDTGTVFLMDTLTQMKVYGENAKDVINTCFDRLREIENDMSKTIEGSDIYRINEAEGDYISLEPDTFEVIETALYYSRVTEGKFDLSIGPLVSLWGIGTKNARVPSEEEIKKAMSKVNYNWVETDMNNNRVKLMKEGMTLDLGAIVKGYAADEVREILEAENIDSAYVNLGGNVLVVGSKPDGSSWKVGIQDPRMNKGGVVGSIEVVDKTIVTSGNYERYFEKDGVIYHHIIDPTTGYPVRNEIISVSIISEDSFVADALSTSVFIMGIKKGLSLINSIENVDALIINKELGIIMTDGLKDKFKLLNDDFYFSGK
ncbi:MAG: FAD:protein FMN transferase [Bacillota bacterium]